MQTEETKTEILKMVSDGMKYHAIVKKMHEKGIKISAATITRLKKVNPEKKTEEPEKKIEEPEKKIEKPERKDILKAKEFKKTIIKTELKEEQEPKKSMLLQMWK